MAKRRNTSPYVEATTSGVTKVRMDLRWWLADADSVHEALVTRVRFLRGRSRARREMYRFHAEMYGVQEAFGLGLTNYDPANTTYVAPTLPYNVVRRGINTRLAQVTKNKPLPMVLTSHGDYKQSKRARGLSHFIEGAFYQLNAYDKMRECARDALTFGTGVMKVYH